MDNNVRLKWEEHGAGWMTLVEDREGGAMCASYRRRPESRDWSAVYAPQGAEHDVLDPEMTEGEVREHVKMKYLLLRGG